MTTPFDPLDPAEAQLLEGLAQLSAVRLGDGPPPEGPAAGRTVRAELLRFLLLDGAGAQRIPEAGLRLGGVVVTGALDLGGCRLRRDLVLADCRFEAPLTLRSAILDTLALDGSILPAVIADKIEARGGLSLRSTTVAGEMRLPGARLGGGLVCDGGRFLRAGAVAIDGGGLETRGGVMLRGAVVEGVVDLDGARVGHDIDATGATLGNPEGDALRAEGAELRGDLVLRRVEVRGRVALTGLRVGGDVDLGGGRFSAPGAAALAFNRATVAGALMLREGATVEGLLNLNGATVEALVDAPDSWPQPGDLALNRFRYGAFLGAPTDAERRLDWLARQEPARWGEEFWPQPYEQLAAVLAANGHGDEADRVLMRKERLQRRARRRRARPMPWRAALWLKDGLLKVTVGYGRRPLLAGAWLIALWALGAAVFATAEAVDAVRPAPPVVLRAPEWVLCGVEAGGEAALASVGEARAGLAAAGQSQLACWRARPEAASYPPFNAPMFSLDAILPALDTGQGAAWAPDVRHPVGYAAMGFMYAQMFAGWALGLLAVAGFSGLVRAR